MVGIGSAGRGWVGCGPARLGKARRFNRDKAAGVIACGFFRWVNPQIPTERI